MYEEDFEFLKPSDFYYLNAEILKYCLENMFLKTVISLVFWSILSTLCMFGYYATYLFKKINIKCGNWCYK